MAEGQKVPNYLVMSILSLFCCWPLSIVAIIFAAKVNGLVEAGNMEAAMDASKKAKMFSMIAIIGGLVGYIVFAVFYAVVIAAAVAANS